MSTKLYTQEAPIYVTEAWYTHGESAGVTTLVVSSSLSAISVLGLLTMMAISAIRTIRTPGERLFIRTHVGLYFVSLLLTDLAQAAGGLMNIKWVTESHVALGGFCTSQGVVKQIGNLGTALWSLVIAVHTFNLLFLRIRVSDWACYSVLIGVWSTIATFVIIGPTRFQRDGIPYFGVSGYWCWITPEYGPQRLALEYLWVFISAFASFVLYTLVFLRLRGNVNLHGWRVSVRRVGKEEAWRMHASSNNSVDTQMMTVARQMLWYPVAYTVLILPIAACRYASFAGHKVPFAATIFSGAVFMLSGLVNTILFASTRRVVPKRDALLSISITRIQQQSSSSSVLIHKEDVEAYTAPTTLHDINEKALPPIPNGSEESFSSADAHSLPLDFSSLDLAAMRPTSVDTGSVPFGHLRELPATHQVARRSESFHSIASRGSDGSQAPLTRPGRMDVGAGGGRSWNGPTPLWRRSTLGTSDLL